MMLDRRRAASVGGVAPAVPAVSPIPSRSRTPVRRPSAPRPGWSGARLRSATRWRSLCSLRRAGLVLTRPLTAVLPVPELVGPPRRASGRRASCRLCAFPSGPAIGYQLGVAGLVEAFLGIEDGAALLAWRADGWASSGTPRGWRRRGTSRAAARSRATACWVRWAARSSRTGRLERLAGLALARRARGRGCALLPAGRRARPCARTLSASRRLVAGCGRASR